METGTVAAIDHKSTISDLGDTGGCPPNVGQCLNVGGTIVWNATKFEDYCPLALVGNFTGHIMKDHIIVDEIQGAFQLVVLISTCHLENAYSTEQGPVLQFGNNDQQFLPQNRASDFTVTPSDKDPLNPKLQFLYDKIMEQESQIFKTMWTELCRSAKQHLSLIWQLLKLDPTLGARALLLRNDIIASFAGQALMVWECEKIVPEHIFWDYQIATIM
uniref:Uncharacterized protein n=1 Tax=Romanomermis culicivorax TaxID=13658 RepID=A0A915IKK2_ROMCU